MKRFIAIAILGFSGLFCFGQQAQSYPGCMDTANTQTELNLCAAAGAKLADAQLEAVYKKLLSLYAGKTLAIRKIEAERKAWVAYRTAYMEAAYPAPNKQSAYGTIYPMESLQVYTEMTRGHTGEINALVKNFTEYDE